MANLATYRQAISDYDRAIEINPEYADVCSSKAYYTSY